MSSVLKVSTHIYGVSKEIDGKSFIFRVNLGMWPIKLIILEKRALFWGFNMHIYGVSKEIDGKSFIFASKLRHVTPQIDHLWKTKPCSEGFNTYVYGVSKEIDGKMFIFRVNIGMWPLKLIILAKQAMCWGFQHTLMGFLRRYMGNIHFSSKPRHVTPQIDCLRKTSSVLKVSTHIYGVSKEIDGKIIHFTVNLGMWPLKIVSGQSSLKISTQNKKSFQSN